MAAPTRRSATACSPPNGLDVSLLRERGGNQIPVRDDAVERTLNFVDGLPHEATASMHRDLVAGRPSELEAQSGAVVRLAAESGIEVPVNRFLYASLLPAECRARTQ